MKLLRILCGSIIGAIAATVLAWGGLYLLGMIRGPGSLFDTNPNAANLFFALWFALVLAASIVGGMKASRR
ncbi:hypothetical protein LMG29542_06663 [Paraburkholderia humisilvae]|uniref:Uncharacterized protein n=1 Tax=Paraburkholderia humisilvae TaxID=627669 RepID=A0A6J5EZY6_9BURK|nr:hypothetical protein LMG29542_06663 [Paraburkholderia humisilvae]